jgi:hypothetical protein
MFDHPLEERCHEFAKGVRTFCRRLKMDVCNVEDVKQWPGPAGLWERIILKQMKTLGGAI